MTLPRKDRGKTPFRLLYEARNMCQFLCFRFCLCQQQARSRSPLVRKNNTTTPARCILLWMKRCMSSPFMGRSASTCPTCLHPLATVRETFVLGLLNVIEGATELQKLAKDVDVAFEELPKSERDRARRGRREEGMVPKIIRMYRFDPDVSAIVVLAFAFAMSLARSDFESAPSLRDAAGDIALFIFAYCVLFDRQKQFIPNAVVCTIKHLSVLRFAICVASFLLT